MKSQKLADIKEMRKSINEKLKGRKVDPRLVETTGKTIYNLLKAFSEVR